MLKMTVETITPEIATEYLKANTKNYRGKLSRAKVIQYAEDMKAGRWELNGEAIEFNEDGILVNGQHRLAAIVYAKIPIQMAVIRGVKKGITIYDIGFNRTLNQMVAAKGIDTNSTITAAANIIVHGFNARGMSKGRTLAYIEAHESDLNRAYRATCYGGNDKSRTAPCMAASYIMLRNNRIAYYELELFWRLYSQPMITRYDGYDPSPVFVAAKMIDERSKASYGRQLNKERLEIFVNAMDDFHFGNHVEEHYKIAEPFLYEELLNELRKMDKVMEEE